MPNEFKHEARPRNSEVRYVNGNIWRQTQHYKLRRKWTKSHIINVLLTSFARSVRESICLLFFSHRPQENTFPYRPRTRLINLYEDFSCNLQLETPLNLTSARSVCFTHATCGYCKQFVSIVGILAMKMLSNYW